MFIAINPYGPSESVNLLRSALTEEGMRVKKLKRENSRYRSRPTDLVINWGSSRPMPAFDPSNPNHLNNPAKVNLASNKIECLRKLANESVSTVDWTTDMASAQQWVEDGGLVFCRTELRGHSGSGIVCVSNEQPADLGPVEWRSELPTAPLYTLGVDRRHREYRIHVMEGEVLFIQQKRRAGGYRENPNYSNVVRNHGNGWVYSHLNMTAPNFACLEAAVASVEALGLDFGAVDVITHGDEAWVLEINTAPGLSGTTTRERYTKAFVNIYNAVEVLEGIEAQFPALEEATAEELQAPTRSSQGISLPDFIEANRSRPRMDERQPEPVVDSPATVVDTMTITDMRPVGSQEFFVIEVNGQRDVAWLDAESNLYFVARGIGAYPADRVTVIRAIEV